MTYRELIADMLKRYDERPKPIQLVGINAHTGVLTVSDSGYGLMHYRVPHHGPLFVNPTLAAKAARFVLDNQHDPAQRGACMDMARVKATEFLPAGIFPAMLDRAIAEYGKWPNGFHQSNGFMWD